MEEEYVVTGKVLKELKEGSCALFETLTSARAGGVRVSSRVLLMVVEDPKASPNTKALALKIVAEMLEGSEDGDFVIEAVSSLKFMVRVSDILKTDVEQAVAENSEEIEKENTKETMRALSLILSYSEKLGKKERVVKSMEHSGMFCLLNAWCGESLFQLYSSVLEGEIPEHREKTVRKSKKNREEIGQAEGTPYRMTAEESVEGIGTFLAHRRNKRIFTAKYFAKSSRECAPVYRRILEFENEYEIVHRCVVIWCNKKGSLEGAEWAAIWHLKALFENLGKDETYEKEVAFVLGPLFHSSLMNTLDGEKTEKVKIEKIVLFVRYLDLIRKSQLSTAPEIRGACSVAAGRIGVSEGRFFTQIIGSSSTADEEKRSAVLGLSLVLEIAGEHRNPGLRRLLERNAQNILSLLEAQPTSGTGEYCTCVIKTLSYLEEIPIGLFRPTSLILAVWMGENVRTIGDREKAWLRRYFKEACKVYSPHKDKSLLTGLFL